MDAEDDYSDGDYTDATDSDDDMPDLEGEGAQAAPAPAEPAEVEEQRSPLEWKQRGNEHYKAKEYIKSIAMYTKAIAGDPSEPAFLNNRAAAYIMLLDYKASLADAHAAHLLKPDVVKYLERMAKCYSSLGRKTDATRTYSKVLELDPSNAAALRETAELRQVENFKKQAQLAAEGGHFNSAVSLLDRALALTPADDLMKLQQAEYYLKQEKVGEAERIAAGILRMNNNNTEALYVRGLCKYEMGDTDQAIMHFKRALQGDPDHKRSRTKLKLTKSLVSLKEQGKQALSSGKYDDALKFYTEALEIDPANQINMAKLYYNRCLVKSKLNDNEGALQDCDAALEADEKYIKALIKRARLQIDLEMYEEAVKACEAACNLQQGDRDLERMLQEAQLELKKSKRKNYYKILAVSKTATEPEIKKAYKKMALKTHPDRCREESEKDAWEAKFKDVTEAYTILSDSEKRARYDGGADIEDLHAGGGGHGHGGMNPNDLFSQFFAGGGGGGGFGHSHFG